MDVILSNWDCAHYHKLLFRTTYSCRPSSCLLYIEKSGIYILLGTKCKKVKQEVPTVGGYVCARDKLELNYRAEN